MVGKRKLMKKMNRQLRNAEAAECEEKVAQEPCWTSVPSSPPTATSSDFLQELQRKDQLLATLLQLDRPLDDVVHPSTHQVMESKESKESRESILQVTAASQLPWVTMQFFIFYFMYF